MISLRTLICILWDSDVSFSEATVDFNKQEIKMMDEFIRINPTVFADGIPFPGDDSIWDEILEHEEAGRLIQKMVDYIEGEETQLPKRYNKPMFGYE